MDKLSYSAVMAILDGTEFPYISISRKGVFISPDGSGENSPEYSLVREMENNHPQKDITKPLFTFPCTAQELRSLLQDYDAVDQLSGVIYLDKGKKYTANEILDLMFQAYLEESSLLPEHEEPRKKDYQQGIIQYLKRFSATYTNDKADEELKTIVFDEMSDVINLLQAERFAVFVNDLATTTTTSEKTSELKTPRDLIIETLLELKYDVMVLPVGNGKKTGAKADVWGKVGNKFISYESFLYHWKKLKKNGDIADR